MESNRDNSVEDNPINVSNLRRKKVLKGGGAKLIPKSLDKMGRTVKDVIRRKLDFRSPRAVIVPLLIIRGYFLSF